MLAAVSDRGKQSCSVFGPSAAERLKVILLLICQPVCLKQLLDSIKHLHVLLSSEDILVKTGHAERLLGTF